MDERYFDWIACLVCDGRYGGRHSYRRLLACLHEREFTYLLPIDENRAIDGVDLRYRFVYETGAQYIPMQDEPCSVLEMMAALCLRCEEQIMDDPDIGNRTSEWFFAMIDSMGLRGMTDDAFNERIVQTRIDRCLERRYEPDGRGGFFTVPGCRYDMRKTEIWYQAMWYLTGRT